MEDGGFVTIDRSCETEFTEKKSVFKTSVFTVCSDNDANELINIPMRRITVTDIL